MPDSQPSKNESPLTIKQARSALEAGVGDLLSTPGIAGVSVGLRRGGPSFVVACHDHESREKFLASNPTSPIEGFPLHVELSTAHEAGGSAIAVDPASLVSRPSLLQRVWRALVGLRALAVP